MACAWISVKPEVADQVVAGAVGVLAFADGRDHLVQDVQRTAPTLRGYGRGSGARVQVKLRPAADDLLAMLDEQVQHALEAQRARLAVDQRQHLHPKTFVATASA